MSRSKKEIVKVIETIMADDKIIGRTEHMIANALGILDGTKNHFSYITIKKAKIKDAMFLEAEYTEELTGHGSKTTKLSCTVPVHQDLKNAFYKLHTHLAILCDGIEAPDETVRLDTLEIPGFGVRSFTTGGSDDSEGVVISGFKEGNFGLINLNTPFVRYDNEDYPFRHELSEAIEMCIYEVKEYLFNGKKAPDVQLEFDFEAKSVEEYKADES